jgi:tryptophan 7-halogenase
MSVAVPRAPLSRVVIVGGGSAGWMTAAALARLVPAGTEVTLVESDELGTVGVGEATIPPLLDFNAALGIDENEFVAATQGTFKLGIAFEDWGHVGNRYVHPFGKYGRSAHGISFHQIWLRQHLVGPPAADPGPFDHYAISIEAAARGRFSRPVGDPEAVLNASLTPIISTPASMPNSCAIAPRGRGWCGSKERSRKSTNRARPGS